MKRLPLILLQAGLTGSCLAATPSDGILIDEVWSGHPVGFAFLTERGHQFVAYYDAERRLTVTGRELGHDEWTRVQPDGVMVANRQRMSNVTGWDSHNRLVLALDRDGCLHLSGNMHVDPLVYYRTRQPFDLTTLERIDRMTGEREQRVTYPNFFRNDEGDLLFRYRDGGSGDGSDLYNIYDPSTRTWRRLFDGPLLEGEGERSAYGSGPQRGPDGRFHLIWMWRDTPDAMTNHTLSYARSRDLVNWETSTGRPIVRPITMTGGEVIDAAKPGEGLINMTYALGFDARQRPVAAYHRYDEGGHSQIFVARPDGDGRWRPRQVSDWDFRWEFPGPGSQVREVSVGRPRPDADGRLSVDFSAKAVGAGRWQLDGETLESLATETRTASPVPRKQRTPVGDYPGLSVKTATSRSEGTRWELRWETLGPNRDLMNRNVPPPSELRLYEFSEEPGASGDDIRASEPRYFAARPGALAEVKARVAAGDAVVQPALESLVERAGQALRVAPPSVTHKTRLGASRDPHDYYSQAPYLWPDPNQPDGLPYIARDGQVNPESREGTTDPDSVDVLGDAVDTLALAYYFTGDETYAAHAARCLRVWFLDPSTRMNPNMNQAQAVPGKNTGRGIGIIEAGGIVRAVDAAGLLAGSQAWTTQDDESLRAWVAEFLEWLLTSEHGRREAAMKQNHGTMYDVRVSRLALTLGRPELATEITEAAREKRIAVQIEPDGRQPLELRRTKSFNYSRLNLRGLCSLATLAQWVNVDLWSYETADGRSIRKALDFMLPYVQTPPKKWPYQQIVPIRRAELAVAFRQAAVAYRDPGYEQVVAGLPGVDRAAFQLLNPAAGPHLSGSSAESAPREVKADP